MYTLAHTQWVTGSLVLAPRARDPLFANYLGFNEAMHTYRVSIRSNYDGLQTCVSLWRNREHRNKIASSSLNYQNYVVGTRSSITTEARRVCNKVSLWTQNKRLYGTGRMPDGEWYCQWHAYNQPFIYITYRYKSWSLHATVWSRIWESCQARRRVLGWLKCRTQTGHLEHDHEIDRQFPWLHDLRLRDDVRKIKG